MPDERVTGSVRAHGAARSTTPDGTSERAGPESWLGVTALSLGVFAFVMAEFLPASLLPRISADLDVSTGAAGQAVSVTAFAGAASALFISVVLPRADRRRVMMGLTLLATASNVAVAIAPDLLVLLVARLLLGVALGGFWAMSTAVAAQLVRAEHLGRALTIINSGVALATVAAVPLGTYLGDVWGWRWVFVMAAGVALIALLAQALTLPSVRPGAESSLRALGAVLRSRVVVAGLVSILLVFAGHFGGFTYIRPATEAVSDLDAGAFAVLLLVFGATNLLGTLLAGPLADRSPRLGLFAFPVLLGTGMLVLFSGGSTAIVFVAAGLWGFGFGGVPTTVLSWGARTEPTRIEQVGGAIVTVANLAIAVGAGIGGILTDRVSATASLPLGAATCVAGGLLLTYLNRARADDRT
ncbi:MFS transporter [Aeromicrobium wangtongii]|uniref:MFS transporter n=1 Tax=Aeromicrobium wangtongii TaxID=2969247 RepID=A0ABY5MDB5_9ACTN|nr:MFS transporter [Aeromicrobium wangtongii]MCD9197172.1 MFS transporter [Aeromicrobium wangtongii]UUP14668.1 MFS transporter [Aeromicrobium wangtongii]